MNEDFNNNIEPVVENNQVEEQNEVLENTNNEVLDNTNNIQNDMAAEIKRIEDQGIDIDPKTIKKIIRLGIIAIILLGIYFIILNPIIKFKSYEKTMLKATERYYELNPDKVPTGNRVGTITLKTLFNGKYIEKDFYIPFSKKACSITKSWVKTRAVDNEVKNYVYLYCGKLFQSRVDHTGPVIKLNGEEKMTINKGEEFKDPGVASVKDASDGNLSVKDVIVKNKIDASSVGKETITYTAYDYLNNKSVVTREVTIVEKIANAVKTNTKDGYYVGSNPNNYLMFGRGLYRIVGIDSNKNVQITTDSIIGNVNYDGLDDYLNSYYELLPDKSKELIVESEYCNQTLKDSERETKTCNSKTEKRKSYILSIDMINKSTEDGGSFLKTFAWSANTNDKEHAYVVTDLLGLYDSIYLSRDYNEYYGVKPLITIKGELLIRSGNGTKEKPYELTKDVKVSKPHEKVNERIAGEYIVIGGSTWRILKPIKDEPTKIISVDRLKQADGIDVRENNSLDSSSKFNYNPKKKGNIAYIINNQSSRYLNTKYLVKHEIEVPIYKNRVLYKKETDTKKYTVKYSAPDVFELYAIGENTPYGKGEYYHLNSSNTDYNVVVTSETGIPEFLQTTRYVRYGIKVVSYLDKDVEVVSGKGTIEDPYVVSD